MNIPVTKEVLIWARERLDLSLTDAANKAKIDIAQLVQYEKGENQPTLGHFRELCKVYNLPEAVLFRITPPDMPPRPTDYRTLEGRPPGLKYQTLIALDKARNYEESLLGLIEADASLKHSLPHFTMQRNPAKLGEEFRSNLGITFDAQLNWNSERRAFIEWRVALGDLGVYAFLEDFPRKDCRGFSLFDNDVPIIVISTEDTYREAQIFSLIHELGHLVLNRPGFSDEKRDGTNVERFCNAFAAGLLMPSALMERVVDEFDGPFPKEWTIDEIRRMSKMLKISQQAIAIRLETLKYAPEGFFDRFKEIQPKIQKKKDDGKNDGKDMPVYYPVKIFEMGKVYINTVLDAFHGGKINSLEARSMLDVRPDNFNKLREKANS